jgi:hypothetical protein
MVFLSSATSAGAIELTAYPDYTIPFDLTPCRDSSTCWFLLKGSHGSRLWEATAIAGTEPTAVDLPERVLAMTSIGFHLDVLTTNETRIARYRVDPGNAPVKVGESTANLATGYVIQPGFALLLLEQANQTIVRALSSTSPPAATLDGAVTTVVAHELGAFLVHGSQRQLYHHDGHAHGPVKLGGQTLAGVAQVAAGAYGCFAWCEPRSGAPFLARISGSMASRVNGTPTAAKPIQMAVGDSLWIMFEFSDGRSVCSYQTNWRDFHQSRLRSASQLVVTNHGAGWVGTADNVDTLHQVGQDRTLVTHTLPATQRAFELIPHGDQLWFVQVEAMSYDLCVW